jgi:hypothetical protein
LRTGVVHAEAITSTTYLGGVTSARETAVGGGGLCAAIDDGITTVTLLVPLDTGVDVILTVAKSDAVFHGHVCGAGVSGGGESSALNVIPADGR